MKKCDKCARLGIIKHCGDLKLFLLYKDYVKKLIEEDGFIVVQGQYSVFDACRNADVLIVKGYICCRQIRITDGLVLTKCSICLCSGFINNRV